MQNETYRRREIGWRWRCMQVVRSETLQRLGDWTPKPRPRQPVDDTVDGPGSYRPPDTGGFWAGRASRPRAWREGRWARGAPREAGPTPGFVRTSTRRSGGRRARSGRPTAALRRRGWWGRTDGRRSTRDRHTSDERSSWWIECTGSQMAEPVSSQSTDRRLPLDIRTLWRPLLPYGYSYKASLPDRVKPSFVIVDIRALWRVFGVPGCQKLQMTA